METEIWKALPGVPGIEVSTLGRVRTLDRLVSSEKYTRFTKGRVLKQYLNHGGYLQVGFHVNGKRVTKSVHRLVSQTFIPNTNNLPMVNHLDCDRTNNNISNLEWCSALYNSQYRDKCRHTAKNNAPKSPVFAINLTTLEVSQFRSQHEASRTLGFSQGNINGVIIGKTKKSHGYLFVNDDGNAVDIVKKKLHDIGKTGLKLNA